MALNPSELLRPNQFPYRGNRKVLYFNAFAVILVVVFAVVGTLLYLNSLTKERVFANSQTLVKSLDLMFESDINTVDVALAAMSKQLSDEIYRQHASVKDIDRYLESIQKSLPHADVIRATDERGDVLFGLNPSHPQVNVADREYFEQLRNDPDLGMIIFEPHMAKTDQVWRWTFIRRIDKPDGSFGGVVYVALDIAEIQSMLNRLQNNSHDVLVLRDKNFRLVSHQIDGGNTISFGDPQTSPFFRKIVKEAPEEEFYEVKSSQSADGVRRLFTYRVNSRYGFLVANGIDWNDAFATWYLMVWIGGAFLVAFIAAILLLVRFIQQNWAREEQDILRHMKDEKKLATLLETASDGVHVLDVQGNLVDWSSSFLTMLGYSKREALHLKMSDWDTATPLDQIPQRIAEQIQTPSRYETQHRKKDGSTLDVEINSKGIVIDGQDYLYASSRDITERKRLEEQIRHMAYYDALTDLPNRRLLNDRLGQALVNIKRSGLHGALMFIDLDNFKPLNDLHGHAVGDQLLIEVGRRLKACIREMDTVARIGGDEFVALIGQLEGDAVKSLAHANLIAEKIHLSLSQPYQFESLNTDPFAATIEYHCASSIGGVVFSGQAKDIDAILSAADTLMYEAKQAGRNQVRLNRSVI